jgi:hypothetical protein
MAHFPDYIRARLVNNGYETVKQDGDDLFMRTPDNKLVWILYLSETVDASSISAEGIRRALEFPGYLLVVAHDSLIPQEIESREKTPMWLRTLHGLYMGRVYTWNGRFLYGLHFDWETGDINESGAMQPDDLLLVETGTWLRGWPGTYRLARFYDKAWWVNAGEDDYFNARRQAADDAYNSGYAGGRDNYQQQYQNEWRPPEQEPPKQRYGYHYQNKDDASSHSGYRSGKGNTYEQPKPPPKQEPLRDFVKEFMVCKNKTEVKALYRKLAREHHPDLNPGKDTTAVMQSINAAYARAERMF